MTRDIFLDNAVVRREEDAFNRWPFSKRLADTIAGFDAGDGAPVLGVFGKWGYGKTTVLNFVQSVLETDYADRMAIFAFNPWLFKDPEALLGAFFAGLAHTVDARLGSVGKEAGAILAKYGGALSAVPLVGAGLGKLAENVGKEMAADPVQAQRDRLMTIMRNAPRTVVVLIDDLDRLDRDEIMTMLKVVRLSANFPHVIYLLAFDEERVARVAGQAYGEAADGRQFLEKIIQHPFSLPAVGHERLLAFVMRQARAACDAAGITLGSGAWDSYQHICADMLMVRLTTPRQAIRYANALRFALPMLKGEVDPLDQMLVEAMRLLFPEIYALARDRPLVAQISADARPIIRQTMPRDEDLEAGCKLLDALTLRDEAHKRVFDLRYHDRYFSYAVAPDDISDTMMDDLLLVADADDPEPVRTAMMALAETKPRVLLERLPRMMRGLGLRQAETLARAVAAIGPVLSGGGSYQASPYAEQAGTVIAAIANAVFGSFDSVQAAVCDAQPMPFALVLYGQLARHCLTERDTDAGQRPDEGLRTLGQDLAHRIRDEAAAMPPYGEHHPKDALRLLQHWQSWEPEEERAWLGARLTDYPGEAEAVLALFPDQEVNYQFIGDLADPAVLAAALHAHFAEDLTDGAAQSQGLMAARSFLDAHARRSAPAAQTAEAPPAAATDV